MAAIDDKINSLSSEELDMLHSDPQLLSDFKAKYSNPSFTDQLGSIASDAVKTALPSPSYATPLSPTSSNPVIGGAETALQTLRDPTRISPSISQPADIAGKQVEKFGEDINAPITGKLGGFVTKAALDPQSYIFGADEIGKSLRDATSAKLNDTLPGVFDTMAKIPPRATEEMLAKGGKLPSVTPEEVEQASAKVAKTLQDAVDKAGDSLNKAKDALGIPTSAVDREASIVENGNPFGVGKDVHADVSHSLAAIAGGKSHLRSQLESWANQYAVDPDAAEASIDKIVNMNTNSGPKVGGWFPDQKTADMFKGEVKNKLADTFNYVNEPKSPEELVQQIANFKKIQPNLPPETSAKIITQLQDRISGMTSFDKPVGDITKGVLKTQYGDLADMLGDHLQTSKSGMSDVLNIAKDLKNKVSVDNPGKTQAWLHNLFTSNSPKANDYIAKLAQLEHISGQPVLQELFNKFASQSYGKYVGRPFLATEAGLGAAGAGMFGNVAGMAGAAGLMTAQSPKLLGLATRGGIATGRALSSTPALIAGMQGVRQGFTPGQVNPQNASVLQSLRDRLRK